MKKKTLLIQFRFNPHAVKMRKNHFDGYTLDKYLTLDIWSQIYTKLNDPIDEYMKDETKQPRSSTIKMNRAQLNLNIEWSFMDSMSRQACKAERMDSENICPMVLTVQIAMYSMIDKYKKDNHIKAEPKQATNGATISSTPSTPSKAKQTPTKSPINSELIKSQSNGIAVDVDEEYVPTATVPTENGLHYTPSTVSNSNSAIDEYTPPSSGDADQVVTYTPTKIAKSQSDEGVMPTKKHAITNKTDVNRNDSRRNRELADLFGDSDDTDGGRVTRSTKKNTQIRHVTLRKEPKGIMGDMKGQPGLSKWFKCKDDDKLVEATKRRRLDSADSMEMDVKPLAKEPIKKIEPISEMDKMKLLSAKLDKQIENASRTVDPLYVIYARVFAVSS